MKVLDNMQTSESSSDSDELKTCPECGGKKEVLIEIFGAKRKVACLCTCETEERDRLQGHNIRSTKTRIETLEMVKK